MEYGLAGIMQPVMKFGKNSNGGCDYDCTICSEICPTDALRKLTTKEKHLTQVGKVEFFIENCVVYTNGTSCGACSEQCPTQAISMQAYKNGLTIPVVNVDFCVGCGACEYSCPVQPFKAVHIVANLVHQQAKPIDKSENIEIEINDFGF
jgi:formate hydrogenlyase subunit 6/NADH:ubiquinone oxidoreductase subunit I